jgi:hypothetical protein
VSFVTVFVNQSPEVWVPVALGSVSTVPPVTFSNFRITGPALRPSVIVHGAPVVPAVVMFDDRLVVPDTTEMVVAFAPAGMMNSSAAHTRVRINRLIEVLHRNVAVVDTEADSEEWMLQITSRHRRVKNRRKNPFDTLQVAAAAD